MLAAVACLTSCSTAAAPQPSQDRAPTNPLAGPASTTGPARPTGSASSSSAHPSPALIQGNDPSGAPYGRYTVKLQAAPHLVTPPANDPAPGPSGYRDLRFTLTFSNPTASPEQFRAVGFFATGEPTVYLTVPSADSGTTPETAFGGPPPGTGQDRAAFWQGYRKGRADLFGFPTDFSTNNFVFQVAAIPTYTSIPDVLPAGHSLNVEYHTVGNLPPDSPVDHITVWAGIIPQQIT